jgi:hypothetical protein
MRIHSGTLLLTGSHTNSGNVHISDGATLEIRGFRSVLDAPCAFTGRGLLRVMATGVRALSTNSVEPTIQIGRDPVGSGEIFFDARTTVHECILINGTLGGTNVVTITNFQWQGGLLADNGTIFIPPSGQAIVSGTGLKRVGAEHTLINAGYYQMRDAGTVTGSSWERSYMLNSGLFEVQSDGQWFTAVDFVNTGTMMKSGGTGLTGLGFLLTNSGTVVARSGTLGFQRYVQLSGSLVLDGGNIQAPLASMDIIGGNVTGSGIIYGYPHSYRTLGNWGGDINPGARTGRLDTGSFIQGENGRLNIEIGGTIPGVDFDCMIVNGEANLSGSLNLMLVNGFVPGLGDRFEILSIGNEVMSLPNRPIPREFTRINGTDLGNGLMFSPEYSPTNLVLTVVNAPTNAWYLTGVRTPIGAYRISFRGNGQTRYVIQASTMFDDWLDLFTNSSSSGLAYYDYEARNLPYRFYRLRATD